jgi:hypothetical protein
MQNNKAVEDAKKVLSIIGKTVAFTLLVVMVLQDVFGSGTITNLHIVNVLIGIIALVALVAGVLFEKQEWKEMIK